MEIMKCYYFKDSLKSIIIIKRLNFFITQSFNIYMYIYFKYNFIMMQNRAKVQCSCYKKKKFLYKIVYVKMLELWGLKKLLYI